MHSHDTNYHNDSLIPISTILEEIQNDTATLHTSSTLIGILLALGFVRLNGFDSVFKIQ